MADRVTGVLLEVIHVGVPHSRVTFNALEVLHTGAPKARVSTVIIEVLRSIADAPGGSNARGTVSVVQGDY